jgi:hypothetical protein
MVCRPEHPQLHLGSTRPLSLARARGNAVGLGASGGGTVGLAVGAAVAGGLGVREVGEGSLAHAAKRLASRLLATRLLVRGGVEGDEENQVRAEDGNTRERGELLTGALASVGHPGEVGRGEVGVGREVDEA